MWTFRRILETQSGSAIHLPRSREEGKRCSSSLGGPVSQPPWMPDSPGGVPGDGTLASLFLHLLQSQKLLLLSWPHLSLIIGNSFSGSREKGGLCLECGQLWGLAWRGRGLRVDPPRCRTTHNPPPPKNVIKQQASARSQAFCLPSINHLLNHLSAPGGATSVLGLVQAAPVPLPLCACLTPPPHPGPSPRWLQVPAGNGSGRKSPTNCGVGGGLEEAPVPSHPTLPGQAES